jgi:hypothetical protein
MKKVFLIIAIALVSLNINAQVGVEKLNTDDLIGYWKPDQESAQLFFWKDSLGRLQSQEISGTDGEPIDLITLIVEKDYVFIRTVFIPNNWVTENTYTFINKTTLKCIVTGDGNGIIIYTKIK